MSQHDFNIANQGFPGFRSDLNNALEALVSLSSGSSAPSATFNYQIWVDTSVTPALLKIRNGVNDAWISLGSIDSSTDVFISTVDRIRAGSGSAALPSLSFSGDTDSGIYSPGANALGFAVNGADVIRVTSAGLVGIGTNTPSKKLDIVGDVLATGDVTLNGAVVINAAGANKDFRVEGDTDATLLFTDASADRVGIGTNTPGTKLHVNVASGASVARFTNGTTTTEVGTASTNVAYFGTTSNHSARIIQNNVTCLEVASGLVKIDNGYGSLQTIFGCRAWVNFNGTGTVAIRSSGNVSSVTDNGAGLYTVNFTNSMPDSNYTAIVSASGGVAGGGTYDNATSGLFSASNGTGLGTYSTAAVQIWFSLLTQAATGNDREVVNVAIFR